MTHRDTTCVLCGAVSPDVRFGLIAWSQPVGRDVFTAAPRCADKAGCRTRVEANGDRWEVVERPVTTRELVGEQGR